MTTTRCHLGLGPSMLATYRYYNYYTYNNESWHTEKSNKKQDRQTERHDINRRISLPSTDSSSCPLCGVWKGPHLSIKLHQHKIRYLPDSRPVSSRLLYAAETRTPLAADIKPFEAFYTKCERQLLQAGMMTS